MDKPLIEVRVWLGPERPEAVLHAIDESGGSLVAPEDANVIVWYSSDHESVDGPKAMTDVLHPGIRWVQLESAGIERYLAAGVVDRERTWTSAAGAYSDAVAEHVVMCLLASVRLLHLHARASTWQRIEGSRLAGRTVGIIGAGGSGKAIISRLTPFGVRTIALTRSGRTIDGADLSLAHDELHTLLRESDDVVISAPLTTETRGLLGEHELELIGPNGTLINVSRGAIVKTDAVVAALSDGRLGSAYLDVTDPEPLPVGHPLWSLPNAVITPHVANTLGMLPEALATRVAENIDRFRERRELLGIVNLERGY
jgi:phosphoglycerate dehydrogenase-like enzyme